MSLYKAAATFILEFLSRFSLKALKESNNSGQHNQKLD